MKSKEKLSSLALECEEIVKRVENFYEALKKVWMQENKPFGFEVQTVRIGAVIQRMKDCKNLIDAYLHGDLDKIEELEEIPLPHPEYNTNYLTLFSAGTI